MSKIFQRMKNLFSRNPTTQHLPPGSFPNASGDTQSLGTIRKASYVTDEEDEEDNRSMKNYNVPEQTRLRGQPRDTLKSDDSARSGNPYGNGSALPSRPVPPSNPPFRGTSNGFITGLSPNNNQNNNNNMNSLSNTNTGSTPGLPFLSQVQNSSSRPPLNPIPTITNNPSSSLGGFPPGMNSNQSAPPPPFGGFPPGMNPNQSAPPPPFGGFPPGMNPNQTQSSPPPPPPPNNSQTSPESFPPGMNPPPSSSTQIPPKNDSNNSMNTQQALSPKGPLPFQNRSNDDDNVSRLELDYPIENVLIDANIPRSTAVKINETVEHDRLGNAYHIHRYTFQPSSQQISFSNDHHNDRRSHRHSHHGGTRHIREIHNDHQNPLFDDIIYHQGSNKHHQPYDRYSETSLNQYIDRLLRTPGSTVVQAQNVNGLQHILGQNVSHNQIIPTQLSINSFQSNAPSITEPIFYYTARALPNDPMRNY